MGTNTSREMEDLQRALQEAELTPTIYGGDSRPATAKTVGGGGQLEGGDQNQNNMAAAAFNLMEKKGNFCYRFTIMLNEILPKG